MLHTFYTILLHEVFFQCFFFFLICQYSSIAHQVCYFLQFVRLSLLYILPFPNFTFCTFCIHLSFTIMILNFLFFHGYFSFLAFLTRALEAMAEPWCKNAMTVTITITTQRYGNESEIVGLVSNIDRNHEISLERA